MNDEPDNSNPLAHILRRGTHIQRRHELAGSRHIPAELASPFTVGGLAVLKVIADEYVRRGACTLSKDAIANLSGTSKTVAKHAIRAADTAGLIRREQSGRYTKITITSAKWKAWLDHHGDAPRAAADRQVRPPRRRPDEEG
jgi:hypothetical protein